MPLGDALNSTGDGGAVQRVNGCTERSNARAAVKVRSRSGKTLALESVPQFQLLQHCRRRAPAAALLEPSCTGVLAAPTAVRSVSLCISISDSLVCTAGESTSGIMSA